MTTPSRYLVTGGAGFIGARVADKLLDAGHEVVVFDNLDDNYDLCLKEWRLAGLALRPRFSFERIDITNRLETETAWRRHGPWTAVAHLAGRPGVRRSLMDPHGYFTTNAIGTLNLLELCRSSGVRHFVLASSSSVYGNGLHGPCNESGPTTDLTSPYASSKLAAEAFVQAYARFYDIHVAVLRYFSVYGPSGRPDMSPLRFVNWIEQGLPVAIFGDGSQARDFTYVDDVARATVDALTLEKSAVLNIGRGKPLSLIEVVRLVEEATGKEALVRYHGQQRGDVELTWADPARARDVLGWEPQVSMPEGIDRLVAWYRSNAKWLSQLHSLQAETAGNPPENGPAGATSAGQPGPGPRTSEK